MTYVYAGAADWGGKDPAKCNRGLYRLATDTGTWTTLERGLPDEVEVRCVTLHPTQPGVVFAGTQAGPYRSTDAGATWERMPFPGDEPVVWSCEIHPAEARVMYVDDHRCQRADARAGVLCGVPGPGVWHRGRRQELADVPASGRGRLRPGLCLVLRTAPGEVYM